MKRHTVLLSLAGFVVLGVLLSAAPAARADVNMYFRGGVASGPLAFSISNEPRVVLIPGTSVYYVEDTPYDVYRYGGSYYVYDEGYWYRARAPRGPFYAVPMRAVPRTIVYVPQGYRRHWVTVPAQHRTTVIVRDDGRWGDHPRGKKAWKNHNKNHHGD